jgi:hypothetical protein
MGITSTVTQILVLRLRYTPLPPTKRYSYYKHFGFAGRGAKTSWAHNPTKKPVLAAFQEPLSAACSSI